MNMRKTSIFLIGMLVCSMAFGQKKPKINKVDGLLRDGELMEAKSIVDVAVDYEKIKDDEKTWFLRALTYAALDTTAGFRGTVDGALETSVEAFDKAAEMGGDKEPYLMDGGFPVTMTQYRDQYYAYYFNIAAAAFGSSEYQKAVDNFESSQKIVSADTNAYINAAYAAQNGKLYDAAIRNYEKATEKGAKDKDLFSLWSYLLDKEKDNPEAALEVVNKSREVYPNDVEIAKSQINLLIKLERTEEARDNLISAIENEPDNPDLRFSLGVLYDELGDADAALKAYGEALEVDPNHYNANYNMGVIYINKANDVTKEINSLGMSKADLKKAEELAPKKANLLKEALPQWEKLNELQPGDETTLETLQYIYNQLDMDDKAEAIKKQLKGM